MSEEESTARQQSDGGRPTSDDGRQATRRNVRVMPLNSRRLTNAQLRLIAHAMSLPVSGIAGEQMRQMIDGKLMAMEREPRNVQVLITEAESGEALTLQDEGGVFVEATLSEEHDPSSAAEETEGIATDTGDERGQQEDSEGLPQELERIDAENRQLREQLVEQQEENTRITEALVRERVRVRDVEATSTARIEELSSELKKEREKARVVWLLNCEQIAQYDRDLDEKEREIVRLRALLAEEARGVDRVGPTSISTVPHSEGTSGSSREGISPGRTEILLRTTRGSVITEVATGIAVTDSTPSVATRMPHTVRRGKAPPVDPFTGEGSELRLNDWLPYLERAATWNGWTDEERLMQFAGHLLGRALMEWNLLNEDEKK